MFGFGNQRKQLERQYLRLREKEANAMFASRSNDIKTMYRDSKQRLKLLDEEMAQRNVAASVASAYIKKEGEPDGD